MYAGVLAKSSATRSGVRIGVEEPGRSLAAWSRTCAPCAALACASAAAPKRGALEVRVVDPLLAERGVVESRVREAPPAERGVSEKVGIQKRNDPATSG